MKKLICIILSMTMLLSFSGCSVIEEHKQDEQYVEEQAAEIIRCFNEKDAEGLKELFCQHSKDSSNLDVQIENAFKYYEGVCTSDYYVNTHGGWAGSIRDGKYVDKHNVIDIQNIVTNEGNEYVIGYAVYKLYDADSGRIGISAIDLMDRERKTIVSIDGYDWLD